MRVTQGFEKQVFADLKDSICFEFPPPPGPLSELAFERAFHTHFVEERSRHFIGRQDMMEELRRHAQSNYQSESLPLVVVGAPGSGKTSLVAAFAKWCVE